MPKEGIINITDMLTLIIADIAASVEEFSHINMKHLLVCVGSNKNGGRGGTYGKLVPMRFKNGSEIAVFKGKQYAIPHLYNNDDRILYLIYFYMPKFFDLNSLEKLKVIFHELYHISPSFNGDIRRMGKVKSAHGSSRKSFDRRFEEALRKYHSSRSGSELFCLLELDSVTLHRLYRKVYARRVVLPRPVVVGRSQNS